MSRLIRGLAALFGAPIRAARLMVRVERQLVDLRELARATNTTTADLASDVRRTDERLEAQGERLVAVEKEIEALRRDVSDRLLQANLQLGALTRILQRSQRSADGHGDDDASVKRRLSARPIPLSVDSAQPQWAPVIGGDVHPDPKGDEWLVLDACPFCGHDERSVVVEWNKLIMMAKAPDQQSARYNYSLCHTCGVVYAARRPAGRRFEFLLQHFGEMHTVSVPAGEISDLFLLIASGEIESRNVRARVDLTRT